MPPSSSHDEASRVKALHAYAILDTPPEKSFEHITSVVTRLFNVPIAAVTLVDSDRQWFKSICGLDVREMPRDLSFCAHAMLGKDVMTIPDTLADPRFANHPLVTGPPGIRFYAGAPLRDPDGHPLGALCVIDYAPRRLSPAEEQVLVEMASLVEDELLLRRVAGELRLEIARRQQAEATLAEQQREQSAPQGMTARGIAAANAHFLQSVGQASDPIFIYDLQGRFIDVNAAACALTGHSREELLQMGVGDIEVSYDPVKNPKRWAAMEVGEAITVEGLNLRKDGSVFQAEVRVGLVDTGGEQLLVGLVRDITKRKQAERLMRIRVSQQQAVAEFGETALNGGKVDDLLANAVDVIASTLQVQVCRVLEHAPEQGQFITRAGLHVPGEEIGMPISPDDASFVSGQVLHTGKTIVIRNLLAEEHFQIAPWLRESGAISGFHLPIGGDGSNAPPYGVLVVYATDPREFTDDDVYFGHSIANVLAAAIARRRGEDALRVVEARYQRIAAHTPGVVYQYMLRADGSLMIPFISESCRDVYGLEPEQIQKDPGLMIQSVHPDDRRGFVKAIHIAKTRLVPLHWRGRHIMPDGTVRWVRFDSRPERLPDGAVICDGIIIDVTEEETREEALRRSEEHFRLAILQAPFPIMLHSDDGRVLQVNDAWTRLTGYCAAELPTIEDWLRCAYPSDEIRQGIREFLAKLSQCVGVIEWPAQRIRCASGENRIWDFSCVNLGRLPDGRWLHITSAIDVTERQRGEAALRLAKEEAERANVAKSVFLSRMSHELRTPLNAILGFGQVLELGQLGEEDSLSLQYILKGGRHLLTLIDEVLDLARLEAGEMTLKPTAFSLNRIALECINYVARMAQARGITCIVEATPACHAAMWADELRLRQVLLNLLTNAIKHNKEGGRVVLSCRLVPNDRVRVSVRDTGQGISPEGLRKLFVPFERLDQELSEVEGTGLGLVVSRNLVEAMGGCLGVESEVGQGSTFWLELPVARPGNVQSADALEVKLPVVETGKVAPATVIYIEDNASNVQLVKTVIERARRHWQFLTAGDGPSGFELVRAYPQSVILLDLQLPGMNGDTVLAKLRADPLTRRTPILLLSADATAHSRDRLLALGANGYLSKPFDLAELLEKIDTLLLASRPE